MTRHTTFHERFSLWIAAGCFIFLLSGCGAPTKQELIAKSQGIKKKDELQKVLGKPDDYQMVDVPMIGSTETWTYKCSDGEVMFQILNDKVVMKAAGNEDKHRK